MTSLLLPEFRKAVRRSDRLSEMQTRGNHKIPDFSLWKPKKKKFEKK